MHVFAEYSSLLCFHVRVVVGTTTQSKKALSTTYDGLAVLKFLETRRHIVGTFTNVVLIMGRDHESIPMVA